MIAKLSFAQWVSQNSGTTNALNSVFCINADTVYVVGVGGTILKTTDGGNNWNAQNSGTVVTLNSVFFVNADTGYAVGDSGTILKTTNGGINWDLQTIGSASYITSIYFTSIDTGYCVGVYSGIFLKTAIYFTNIDSVFCVGGDSGIFLKTTDGGNSWFVDIIFPFQLVNVFFPSSNIGYITGYNTLVPICGFPQTLILKTTDAGVNWDNIDISALNFTFFQGWQATSIFFINDTVGYMTVDVDYGFISKTTNGSSWLPLIIWSDNVSSSVYFPNDSIGYIVGDSGTILNTINNGSSWNMQSSGVIDWLNSVFFADTNIGYIAGNNGIILKTTNGGFDTISQGINNTIIQVDKYLKQNLPNPFKNITTIEYKLPANSQNTKLKIYNLAGKEVYIYSNLEQSAINKFEYYSIDIDLSHFETGIYFYVLESNGIILGKKKMNLIK